MCKLKQPWRHAASVIVAASRSKTVQVRPHYVHHPNDPMGEIYEQVLGDKRVAPVSMTDVSILMAKRRTDSKVMPGAYTFPGGAIHPSDFDTHWADNYLAEVVAKRENPPNVKPWQYLLNVESASSRPPAMIEFHEFNRKLGDLETRGVWMPAEWAFKLCALRELFEETGILICHNVKTGQIEIKSTDTSEYSELDPIQRTFPVSLEEQRKSVHEDASNFKKVCKRLDVIPAFWTLREWSNWLSPSTYATKARFDTIFYVVCIQQQVQATVEEKELEKAEWVDSKVMLKSGSKGEVQLAPPQIYELARLARFEKVEELNKFVQHRESSGLIQFFPLLGKCTDGVRLAILPGDDLYPKKPDFSASDQPLTTFRSTAKEIREKSKRLHRAEFIPTSASMWSKPKLYMNVKPECNHIAPLPIDDDD